MNKDRIIGMIDRILRDLTQTYYVSIVDYDNYGVYLDPVNRSVRYYNEKRFGTTFYKWILQVVPRNYTEIVREVANSRRVNFFFIILTMSLTFLSLAIIYVAGRRERQLTQLKEDFISNVSHELKTPLSLIGMFSEILVLGKVKNDEKKREYYGIIHNESERMSRLIGNLLDFSRLESGAQSKNFENTNIARLVTKELEAYSYQIQKDGFHLITHVDETVPETLADPNALTLAFFNLLDNSVKYSVEQKEITVNVNQVNGFIDLSVSDHGLGIEKADQQKIFEKFYRGNNPVVQKIRGSGIGLSITRHVADMHGGQVLVESEPGIGSTFTIRIPIRQEPQQEVHPEKP
jgi:signal transduction histidine kinase